MISRLLTNIGLFCRIQSLYRALWQKRPMFLKSLLIVATSYSVICQEALTCLLIKHTCAHALTHIYTYTHTHIHTYTHEHIHTNTHTHIHVRNWSDSRARDRAIYVRDCILQKRRIFLDISLHIWIGLDTHIQSLKIYVSFAEYSLFLERDIRR